MPLLSIKARRLKNADVSYVSLVKGGANKAPFKVQKEDEPMNTGILQKFLAATKVRAAKASDAPVPEVLAMLVAKDAGDAVVAEIKARGFEVAKTEEVGETLVLLSKADVDLDKAAGVIVKMDENVSAFVAGLPVEVAKGFESWNYKSKTFGEVMGSECFYPGLSMGLDALRITIGNVMGQAATGGTGATEEVMRAVDDFKAYLSKLLGGIPVSAWKHDPAVVDVVKMAEAIAKAAGEGCEDDKGMNANGAAAGDADADEAKGKGKKKAPPFVKKEMTEEEVVEATKSMTQAEKDEYMKTVTLKDAASLKSAAVTKTDDAAAKEAAAKAEAEAKEKASKDEAAAKEAAAKADAEKVAKEKADKEAAEKAAAEAEEKKKAEAAAAAAPAFAGDMGKLIAESIANALKPMGEQMANIAKSVETLTGSVEQAKKDAAEAKAQATKTEETVVKTVAGGAPAERELQQKREQKRVPTVKDQDDPMGGGLIDTAHSRLVA